ncbi:Cytochrome P450 CYP4/CYP19/CYP26 subfamilies [Phaffia rhodozyma]|uniref:Cytochrome P450 CYP4/CYP19/CYP26 subfamilies n=1 Tax=Phaffia rhodozyma TaxID=264483 RepID=A0A0F7SE71_PHARH|nr:Cytochrome P450 CYP4/CYP19/CYP26 subfamilies [Phaffia rhodozyma]
MLWIAIYILAISFACFIIYKSKPRHIPGVPHMETTEWFFGDLRPIIKNYVRTRKFHDYYELIAANFPGGFYQFHWLAWNTAVVICDPMIIEDIMKKDSIFRRSDDLLKAFGPITPWGSLALPTNAVWKNHRRFFGPIMNQNNLKLLTPNIVQTTENLFNLWESKREALGDAVQRISEEGCFEVMQDLSFLTGDIISDIAFGFGYHQLEANIAVVERKGKMGRNRFPIETNALGRASRMYFEAIPVESTFPSVSHFFYRLRSAKFRQAERLMEDSLNKKIIEGRRKVRLGETKESCLLEMVLEKEWDIERENGKSANLRIEEIRDEMSTLLLAGDDTTSSTMGWALRFLTRNPDVQRRLHAEIKHVLPDVREHTLTYEDIHSTSLPYFDAVIQEILRVSQTVMTTLRTSTVETVVNGCVMPKGTTFLLMMGMAGCATKSSTLPRLEAEKGTVPRRFRWEDKVDVDEFRPERWLKADGSFDINAGPSIPFGTGLRACYGSRLAQLELRSFIMTLSRRYFLDILPASLADPNGEKFAEAVTRRPTEMWIRPRPWAELVDPTTEES